MTDPQQLADRVVAGMLAQDHFSRWVGLTVSALAPGACTCTMTIRPEMVKGFGFAHGGIAYALADSALAFASNTGGMVNVSIDNTILSNGRPGGGRADRHGLRGTPHRPAWPLPGDGHQPAG